MRWPLRRKDWRETVTGHFTALMSTAGAAPASGLLKLFAGKNQANRRRPRRSCGLERILIVPAIGARRLRTFGRPATPVPPLIRENESYEALQARLPGLRRDANSARFTAVPVAQVNPGSRDPKAEFPGNSSVTFPRARTIVFATERNASLGRSTGGISAPRVSLPLQVEQFEKNRGGKLDAGHDDCARGARG